MSADSTHSGDREDSHWTWGTRARVAQTGVLPLRVPAAGFCLGTAQNVTPADFLQLEVFHLPCSSPALPSPVPASL